jgi:tRNA modification GTPase
LLLHLQSVDQPGASALLTALPDDVPKLTLGAKADLASAPLEASRALPVSVKTGLNLDTLRSQLFEKLGDRAASLSSDMLALQPRHEQALRCAIEQLDHAIALVEPHGGARGLPQVEMIADTLRGTLDALAGLGGEMTPDDVLGKVFSTFCIGK